MSDIGALALVKYEYSDSSGWKVKPGLITGEYLNDYQVTFITKEVDKYRQEDTSIIIGNNDLASGGLKKTSILRTHKTFWIEKRQCKRVGTLKTERILAVVIKPKSTEDLTPLDIIFNNRQNPFFVPLRLGG